MSQYEDCVCGLTKDDERKILILKGQNKKSLKDTISHELIHAYLFECGHYLTNVENEKIAHFVGRNFEEIMQNFEIILKKGEEQK